jgi:hypothetical protein
MSEFRDFDAISVSPARRRRTAALGAVAAVAVLVAVLAYLHPSLPRTPAATTRKPPPLPVSSAPPINVAFGVGGSLWVAERGGSFGHVWVSHDGGLRWAMAFEGPVSDVAPYSPDAVVVRVDAANAVVVGAAAPLRSIAVPRRADGSPVDATQVSYAFDANGNGLALYAGDIRADAGGDTRLFRTGDGGATWKELSGSGLPARGSIWGLAHYGEAWVIHVGGGPRLTPALFVSWDDGATFRQETPLPAVDGSVAADFKLASGPTGLLAYTDWEFDEGFPVPALYSLAKTDAGWRRVALPDIRHVPGALAASYAGDVFVTDYEDLWHRDPGGRWTSVAHAFPGGADMIVSAGPAGMLAIGAGGFRSIDYGRTWDEIRLPA